MASSDATVKQSFKCIQKLDDGPSEEEPPVSLALRKERAKKLISKYGRPENLFTSTTHVGNQLDSGTSPWKDGRAGEALGKILTMLFDSYEDWLNKEGDFVQAILDSAAADPLFQRWNINVFVFANDKCEYFFTNWARKELDDTAWFGLLDKNYKVIAFEDCWFARYGAGGWSNWGYSTWCDWRGLDYYRSEGDGKVVITSMNCVDGYPHKAKDIRDAWLDSSRDNDAWYAMRKSLVKASSTDYDDTTWAVNDYGYKGWYSGTGEPWGS